VSVDPPAMKSDQKKHPGRMHGNKSCRSCERESPSSLRSPTTAKAHSNLQSCSLSPSQPSAERSQSSTWEASRKRFCP